MSLSSYIYSQQWRARQRLVALRYGRSHSNGVIDPKSFAPRNVLFVLSGLIGDSVMSLPSIAAAREIWAGAGITVLGRKHNRELIAACPWFDDFFECNADPFSLRRSGEIKELEQWLRSRNFDAAIILLGDQFAHLLARAGLPVRVGAGGTLLERCLTHAYDTGSPRTWGANERLNSLRCLGYSVDPATPRLFVDAEARRTAVEKLVTLGLPETENYAALHPFGSSRRQWWKLQEAKALADHLYDRSGLRTVLVGGPETEEAARELDGGPLVSAAGQLSLGELLAVIERARLVVTTDSGPFHIAGALARPTVGLFRSRRPEHAGAYPGARVVFGKNEMCRTQCDWDRCAAEPCRQMEDIDAADVRSALDEVLSAVSL